MLIIYYIISISYSERWESVDVCHSQLLLNSLPSTYMSGAFNLAVRCTNVTRGIRVIVKHAKWTENLFSYFVQYLLSHQGGAEIKENIVEASNEHVCVKRTEICWKKEREESNFEMFRTGIYLNSNKWGRCADIDRILNWPMREFKYIIYVLLWAGN